MQWRLIGRLETLMKWYFVVCVVIWKLRYAPQINADIIYYSFHLKMLRPDDSLPFYEWRVGGQNRKWDFFSLYGNLTLAPTPPINFSEEDFRWCVMAVAWWILQKGKNIRPVRPFTSIRDRISCLNKPDNSGPAPWIYQRSFAASPRPAMAAHKPVEWVQAVITRFDEQVRWVDSLDGCSNPWQCFRPRLPGY